MIELKEFLQELEILMTKNPDLNVNQCLALATEHCYNTRTHPVKISWRGHAARVSWKLSNQDIFGAVKRYNEMRRRDESLHRKVRELDVSQEPVGS